MEKVTYASDLVFIQEKDNVDKEEEENDNEEDEWDDRDEKGDEETVNWWGWHEWDWEDDYNVEED